MHTLKVTSFGNCVFQIDLFESVSESFLRRISQHVVPVFFMPGDYIMRSGDIGKHVYYIHRGEVTALNKTDDLQIGDSVFASIGLFVCLSV